MSESSRVPLIADLFLARRLESTDAWVSLLSAQIHAQLHPAGGALAEPIGGGYAVFTGVGSPLTQATGLGMKGPVSEADMERLEAFFEVRGSPTQIELCPLADPTLSEQLSLRNYRLREFSNMLVRPLKEGSIRVPPDGALSVQQCTAGEDDLWARTVAEGFAENLFVSDENILVLIDDRVKLLDVIAKQLGSKPTLAGPHPVDVPFQCVDLAVVTDVSIGMCPCPGWKGVRGKTGMDHR